MTLHKVGSRPHPCEPWTSMVPAVAADLLPGGKDASLPVVRRRLQHLESWKTRRGWASADGAGLRSRVKATQGVQAAAAFDHILSGATPVVLTGQQPGFGGGPLFVWLKAHAAIRQARLQSERLGVRVRALFWIAGDDADLSEVRDLSDPVGGASIDSHPGLEDGNRPVGAIPFGPDVAAKVRALWPGSALGPLVSRSQDLSGLLVSCLRHWFGDELAIVDAAWPETRRLAAPAYLPFGRDPRDLHTALERGMSAARSAGLPVAIGSWPDRLRLFRFDGISRRRLVVSGDAATDGAGWSCRLPELEDRIAKSPEEFSHDVVSRPFAAEEAFPVLAHVLGPGEFAYFACLGDLSRLLDRPLAPVLPRASATILPAGPWPDARLAGWDPASRLPGPWSGLEQNLLRHLTPEWALWIKRWRDARSDYLEHLEFRPDDPAREALDRKLAHRESRLLHSRLQERIPLHRARLDSLRDFWALSGAGGLQERLVSPWALEHHLGQPDLLSRMAESIDPDEPTHVVWEAR